MRESTNPSLGELKRETEQTRAGLTQTVEQLRTSVSGTASDMRQRLSPESIKAEVSDYVRSRGERLVEDVKAAAHRNPLQAVAVGAAIAFPLLRIARAIPMPVLLVGAGLFFAGSKTGQSAAQKASDMATNLTDEAGRRRREFSEQGGASAEIARGAVSDAVGTAADLMSGEVDRMGQPADSAGTVKTQTETVRDKASALADTIAAKGRDLRDTVTDLADGARDRVRDLADASSTAQSVMASTRERQGTFTTGLLLRPTLPGKRCSSPSSRTRFSSQVWACF